MVYFLLKEMAGEVKAKIIEVVNLIPYSKVTNYGRVAQVVNILSGRSITAQVVGWILSAIPESEWNQLPRRRVVNKKGEISALKLGEKGVRQREKLKEEGLVFDQNNTIDMLKDAYKFEEILG